MTKVGVWNVSYKDPSDLEDPLPFVGCPHGAASRVVDLNDRSHRKGAMGCGVHDTYWGQHLRHPAEVTAVGIIQPRVEVKTRVTVGTNLALTLKNR